MKRICIITTRHISYNPRVLKEADALYAHGYDVSVVAINNNADQRAFDEELMMARKWRLSTVDFRKTIRKEQWKWAFLSIRHKLYSKASRLSLRFGIAERAAEKAFDGLCKLAKKQRADLYIVHHPEALGAGATAARYHKARLGFDAEDFHAGMNGMDETSKRMISFLEKKYLPGCSYISAASKGIGEAYQEKYGVKTPIVLLNVFPKEDLPAGRADNAVRFYWYSQVIGPNRGLECLLDAAACLNGSFEIHLRGSLHSESYRLELNRLAVKNGIKDKLFLHGPILADWLVGDGSGYDVGLALELNTSINAMICVSNKLFSYLMSGLALIVTDTAGQKDILQCFPRAGRVAGVNDAADLAASMQFYLDHPDSLMEAKMTARSAAMNEFNWETESGKLIGAVNSALA